MMTAATAAKKMKTTAAPTRLILPSSSKGLERYDEFSGIGAIIEVDRDLDYVRAQLNEKLEEVFGLTERDARALMEIEDREEYTTRIYEIAESRFFRALRFSFRIGEDRRKSVRRAAPCAVIIRIRPSAEPGRVDLPGSEHA